MNKFKKLSWDNKVGVLLFLCSFIFLGVMLWACFKPSIWSDESFSLLLIQKSYLDIINVTSIDVHPPLYYFILKFVVSLFQTFNLTPNQVITIAKFVSVVPFVLLLVLDFFKVRKYWGWLCCGIFAVCLTSMPQLMHYSVEIRMYSWALFFVTMCFIHAYGVIRGSNYKNWMILILSGVCAAYTHYFAAVSVIIIFTILLLYFIIHNKSEIRKWFICVIISSVLYLPWLFTLLNQLIRVTRNYWIDPLTCNDIFNYLWFIVSPSSIQYSSIEIMAVLLVISYLFVFIYFIKSKSDENFMLTGLITLILTITVGILVSLLIKPLFIKRYIIVSLGTFWLTFAFLLSKTWNSKKLFVPIIIVVLIVSSISTLTFMNYEIVSNDIYDNLDSFLKQDSIKNDVFCLDVDGEDNTAGCYYSMQYLLGGYHGLKFGINSSDDIFPILKKSNDLYSPLKNNKTVWLFSSNKYNLILKNCTKQNLTIKKYATYNLESNDTYTIYKIS